MKYNKAKAKYNMDFNQGHFYRGKIYNYRYDQKEDKIFVLMEEAIEQDFLCSDFNILFFLI